jgi:hypothetical protein
LETADGQRHEVTGDRILIVKMTTVFHETLTAQVNRLIRDKIKDLQSSAADKSTKKFLADIYSSLAAGIPLNDGTIRCPDDQYTVISQKLPSVVVEIAFSQSIHDLTKKAIQYLTLANGHIQFVIGFDAGYESNSNRLKLHGWALTTGTEREKSIEEEICHGEYVYPGTLAIPLKAFGPPDALALEYGGADLDKKIILTYEELAVCFLFAKMVHKNRISSE